MPQMSELTERVSRWQSKRRCKFLSCWLDRRTCFLVHGPGLSRIADGAGSESWLIRGPQGQVRAQANSADGSAGGPDNPVGMGRAYGYNAWGGRSWDTT